MARFPTGFAALLAAVWFVQVSAANAVLATWTPGPIPADFEQVRYRWESGRMIIAAIKLTGFVLLTSALLLPRAARGIARWR